MEFEKAKEIYNNLFNEFCPEIYTVDLKLNSRLKNTLARTCYYTKGYNLPERVTCVEISKEYLNKGNDEEIIDTLKHELAHVIDVVIRGYTNHDNTWKKIARKMGILEKRQKIVSFEAFKYNILCCKCGQVVEKRNILTRSMIEKVFNRRIISMCCNEKLEIVKNK